MASRLPDSRRVVTAHDESSSAIVTIDEQKKPIALDDGTYLNPLLLSSDDIPATNSQDPTQTQPNPAAASNGGSSFCAYDLPPKYEGPMHRSVTLDYITEFCKEWWSLPRTREPL